MQCSILEHLEYVHAYISNYEMEMSSGMAWGALSATGVCECHLVW